MLEDVKHNKRKNIKTKKIYFTHIILFQYYSILYLL